MYAHLAEKLHQHRRVIAGYWISTLLVVFLIVLVQSAPELRRAISAIAQGTSWPERFDLAMAGWLGTIAVTLLIAALTSLLVGVAVAGGLALLVLILPLRVLHNSFIAGTLLHAPIWIVALTIAAIVLGRSVPLLMILAVGWAVEWSLSGLWRHLPFGVTYRGRASRWVPLAPKQVARRLVPGSLPLEEMADFALASGQVEELDGGLPTATRGEDGWAYLVGNRQNPKWERDIYGFRVSAETRDGEPGTRLEIMLEVDNIGPGLWYLMWIRNAAEDYATHMAARLTGTRDLSSRGRFFARRHKKAQRKTGGAVAQ